MEFRHLPADALRLVISFLEVEDIMTLRACNADLGRRMAVEQLVTSILVEPTSRHLSYISCVSSHLREITVYFRNRSMITISMSLEWIQLLPETLVKIDFDFDTASTIWLRPSSPTNGIPWYENTPCQRYTPIFIDQLLPNLQHLFLSGGWGTPCFPTGKNAPEGSVVWSPQMISLWVRHLPRTLLSLQIPLSSYEDIILPFLPPNLSSLHRLASTTFVPQSHGKELGPLLKAELFESISSLWWPFSPAELLTMLPKFGNRLEVLDFTNVPIDPSCFSLLPKSLRKLTLHYQHHGAGTMGAPLLCLPPDLSSLEMRFVGPNLLDPSSLETESLADFLPKRLTQLSFTETKHMFRPSDMLRGLQKTHTQLIKLEISSMQCFIEFTDLKFVPPSLQTLVVGCPRGVSSPIVSMPWPKDNQLKTLVLRGSMGPIIASHALPAGLTYLEIQEVPKPLQLVQAFPPSLRTLIIGTPVKRLYGASNLLQHSNIPSYWPIVASDIVKMAFNLNSMSSASLAQGPNLPNLSRFIGPVEFSEIPIEADSTELSIKTIQTKNQRLGNGILQHANLHFELPLSSPLPTTITSIELPITVHEISPIWKLRALTSLKVLNITASGAENSVIPSIPYLTTIHINHPCVTWAQCFQSLAFQRVTDLKIVLPKISNLYQPPLQSHFTEISKLSSLTTLSLDVETTWDLSIYDRILAHLPTSITALAVRRLPGWFWNSYSCPTPPPSTFNSILNAVSSAFGVARSSSLRAPKLQLARLELTGSEDEFLMDFQLVLLAPHLKELGTAHIAVTDRLKLIRGLPENLDKIDDLDKIRAICPSVQVFHPRKVFTTSKPLTWIYPALPFNPNDNITCAKALPRCLSELGPLLPHISSLNPYLPPNLTSLDIRNYELPIGQFFFLDLPESVVKLQILLEATLPLTHTHIQHLPPGLLSLTIENLRALAPDAAKYLPPRLHTLDAPQLVIAEDLFILPASLRILRISSLKRNLLTREMSLPPTLLDFHCTNGINLPPLTLRGTRQ